MQKNHRKKFGFYPVLDWYIVREFMIPFSILIISFIILFMLGDMFERLNIFTNSKTASFMDMIGYFLYKIPGNIRFILPISLLLACMYTMANFGKHSEITAMRASGISLTRCGLSIYIISIIVTITTFVINEGFVPEFDRQANDLLSRAEGRVFETTPDCLTYRSTDQRRTWFFKEFDENNDIQNTMIIVKVDDSHGFTKWELCADSAQYFPESGWRMYKCARVRYLPETHLPDRKEDLDSLFFNAIEFPETRIDIAESIKPDAELPILSLKRRLDLVPQESERLIAKYETILYFRLSFPFSCLIGVLLGIPLASKSMRNGIMLSIITASVVVIIYIMTAQIFQVLGQYRTVPSYVGGLFPTFFFLGYAIWHVFRSD